MSLLPMMQLWVQPWVQIIICNFRQVTPFFCRTSPSMVKWAHNIPGCHEACQPPPPPPAAPEASPPPPPHCTNVVAPNAPSPRSSKFLHPQLLIPQPLTGIINGH